MNPDDSLDLCHRCLALAPENEAKIRIPLNLILMHVFYSIRDRLPADAKPLFLQV